MTMLKDFVLQKFNEFVGEYFEDIDPSQLQLSFFGGDVTLHDLTLKKNIFTELGLPFELKAGRCGTLSIKIPWSGLIISQPFELILRDVYLLAVPDSSYTYDPEKEQELNLKRKLKIVEAIESAALYTQDDSDKPEKLGFLARFAMSIVANIRIQIETIHIRFEDQEERCKFGVGILLSKLSIQTTDSEWNIRFKSEHDNFVHKVVKIDGLALYWNSYTTHFSDLNETEIMEKLKQIMKDEVQPPLDFLIGPIRTTTRLAFVIAPDKGPSPFSTPRMVFQTVVDEIALGLNKYQFQNIVQLAESVDFMLRRQRYRKYRPHVPHKHYCREWWKYAFDCVMDEIERKRKCFRWSHIKQSGQDARDFESLLRKRTSTKLTAEEEEEIKSLESRLSIFNIVRIRKLVDLRISKSNQWSWYWYIPWFSSSGTPEGKSLFQELTPAEKASLQKLLRKKETKVPPDYEVLKSDFLMENLKLTLRSTSAPIMILEISDLQTHYVHSEARKNMFGQLKSITAIGSSENNFISKLNEDEDPTSNLMEFNFLRTGSIYNLIFRGESLEVIYDFVTIQKLINCFHIEKDVSIQMLQAKALEKYRHLKELSKKNIKKSLKESRFSIDLMLKATRFVLPDGGRLIPSIPSDVLTVNLEKLKMESVLNLSNKLFNLFDFYTIQLIGFQINFKAFDTQETSELLKSEPIRVVIDQCISDNMDVPKLRVHVHFPSITFIIREPRLLRVFQLLATLPFPSMEHVDDFSSSLYDVDL